MINYIYSPSKGILLVNIFSCRMNWMKMMSDFFFGERFPHQNRVSVVLCYLQSNWTYYFHFHDHLQWGNRKKKKWNERHSAVIALIVTCNFMPIIFFRRFHFPPPYHSIKWPLGPFSTEFREVRLATNGPENQIFHQSPQRKRMLHFTPYPKRFVIARRCRKALLLPK